MKNIFLLAFLFLVTTSIISQDRVNISEKAPSVEGNNSGSSSLPYGMVILWDNTNITPGTSGIISSRLRGVNDTNDVTVADDFVIPFENVWTVDSVWFEGFMSAGTSQPDSVVFTFRSNNGGKPGAIAAERRVTGITLTTTISEMGVKFQTPVVLTEGTYWLEIATVYNTATLLSQGRWNWRYGTTGNGINAHIRARASYFGAPFDWQPVSNLVPDDLSQSFKIYGTSMVVPVELTSFAANVVNNNVTLEWSTATETNNQGFELQRKSADGDFYTLGFINGNGTTTAPQSYSFVDENLEAGNYSYRLKQIDFDGQFEYSNVIEVEVALPTEFSLGQNFPNPFNPTTRIQFSLAEASLVTLKIFNVLGQEVATLLNNEVTQGVHEVNFDASNFNSGVYFYQISAKGNNGSDFNSVKKMILNK